MYASPKVSVILPIFNSEKFLAKCLSSVLSQSFGDFELICINDGSTDNSESILKKYARKDRRVKIITQKNSGAATARNVGLEHATGEYISFVDSDDVVHKDMLNILTDTIKKCDGDMVLCDFGRNNFDNNHENDAYIKKIVVFSWYPEKPFHNSMYQVCWNKLYKKSSIEGIKFRDGMVLSEDLHFNFLVLANIKKYAYVPITLYNHKNNPASVTSTVTEFSIKGIDDFVFAIKDICEKTPPSRISKEYLKQNVINDLALYLWCSTKSIKKSLYAAKKISEMYSDGIIDTNISCVDRKCYMILPIVIGKIANLLDKIWTPTNSANDVTANDPLSIEKKQPIVTKMDGIVLNI